MCRHIRAGREAAVVFGIDADPEMVATARAAVHDGGFGEKVLIVQADAHDIPICSDAADVAFTSAALGNMRDPAKVLAEAHRTLKRNGIICIAEPMADPRVQELWETLGTFKYGYRRRYFSYHELVGLLRRSGFRSVCMHHSCEPGS